MSDQDTIKEGDKVDVEFEHLPYFFDVTVLYIPCATGDSWRFRLDNGDLVYVQNFSVIRRKR